MNARLASDGMAPDQVEVVLWHITHPDLSAPVRLSTDPTERLSVDPLRYGTRSTWQTEDGSPFYFIIASALVPDDKGDAPATAKIVLANVDSSIAVLLRSFVTPATVDMAVVLAATPDLVEFECLGLQLVSSEPNGDLVTLNLSREPLTAEPWPSGKMTRSRFPGLWP